MKNTTKSIVLFLVSITFAYLSFSYVKECFNPFELKEVDKMNQLVVVFLINFCGNLFIHMKL